MPEFALEDILTHLQTVPRGVPALDEILSILHDNLPQVLVHFGLPEIRTWDYAGVELPADAVPAILVSSAIRTEEVGIYFADTHNVMVTVAYTLSITRRQLQDALDIAQLVGAILRLPPVTGPRRRDGQVLWNWLLPAGFGLVPPNWPYYRGCIAQFELRQSPPSNLWSD